MYRILIKYMLKVINILNMVYFFHFTFIYERSEVGIRDIKGLPTVLCDFKGDNNTLNYYL